MNYQQTIIAISLLTIITCCNVSAQQLLDRVDVCLSPSELAFESQHHDIRLRSEKELFENPAFFQDVAGTTRSKFNSIIYGGLSGSSLSGDFLAYQGKGSTDYRIGAYGAYTDKKNGTLAGKINYARGIHRRIGWSAMRQPQLYLPYIVTDSVGGDFYFENYHAEGSYSLNLGANWTLGGRMAFNGEQTHRKTDPRALINTTWLRFNIGAIRNFNQHRVLIDAGYARNKQHLQLRYWRPGQQDRFFVCYGFGLYDIRQSAVLFGKSRMYYIDEINTRLQYMSPQDKPLRLHASFAYSFDNMKTEESDIYNLYESKTHTLKPQILLTYSADALWSVSLHASADAVLRKGYENIIEEYLIDKANNIYDFRTIDTQKNYSYNESSTSTAVLLSRRLNPFELSLQGGLTFFERKETYLNGKYSIENKSITPHAKLGMNYRSRKNEVDFTILYGRHNANKHKYDVVMTNQDIPHLDFQHAFTPYAYYTSNFNFSTISLTYKSNFKDMSAGINCKLYISKGKRLSDAVYDGDIGFASSAPMISKLPDVHNEKWGSLTLFLTF